MKRKYRRVGFTADIMPAEHSENRPLRIAFRRKRGHHGCALPLEGVGCLDLLQKEWVRVTALQIALTSLSLRFIQEVDLSAIRFIFCLCQADS
jgi:hypothetical protein